MDVSFLIKGCILGFSIAAPVGPIGVLCIQRTISHGKMSGLLTGLGAATADGFYGAVAAFGLTIVSNFLVGQQYLLALFGGIFLLYLGIKTFNSQPAEKVVTQKHRGLISDYVSTVFLTLTNPMTILSFVAVFAGLGLGNTNGDVQSAILLVAGVTLGSAAWWILLTGGVGFLRTRTNSSMLKIVNNISGLVMIIFALLALVSVLK
jgi:threonine/homoserine/homoserine lactone efflux protein